MTILLFANNATSRLAVGILPGDTSIEVFPGTGALFPSPGAGEAFKVTMADAATGTVIEIMLCTARSGDVLTVTRAQEGTSAHSYVYGDPVGNFNTAGTARAFAQTVTLGAAAYLGASDAFGAVSAVQSHAGNPNGAVAGNAAVVGVSPPSLVWDTTNSIFWVCTTSGTTSTAVWSANTSTSGTIYCGTSTGSANAQTVTPPVPVTPGAGASIAFTAGYTNTGAMTLNVGTGPIAVYKSSPTGPVPLTGGEVVAGNVISVRDDGTRWQLTATELGTAALMNASSNTGVVAAVTGSFTPGHLMIAADAQGTVIDGGAPGVAGAPTLLNATANGTVIAPGTYDVDTTTGGGGAFAILLPSTPIDGQSVTFYDVYGAWATNNFTVQGNGHTITAGGVVDTTLVCNVIGAAFRLSWSATNTTWEIY